MARTTTGSGGNTNGRRMTLVWIAVAALIIIGLIYWEQVALLYVLATLSLTALLLIVAFADLGGSRRPLLAPNDDAAAAGDGLGASQNASTRTAKGR